MISHQDLSVPRAELALSCTGLDWTMISHQGSVRTKSRARLIVYWPGLDNDLAPGICPYQEQSSPYRVLAWIGQ